MPFTHAVIWLDHHRARVIAFSLQDHHAAEVAAALEPHRLHLKDQEVGDGHRPADQRFFADVADTVEGIEEILIIGPGSAKHELERFLERHRPAVARHVVATETVDRPTDDELLTQAREAFARIDQVR